MEEESRKEVEKKSVKMKADWNVKPYLAIALLTFIVFCCCIVVFFMIYRYNGFATGWQKLMRVLQPIIIGLVIAYLINPIMKFFEKHLMKFFKDRIELEVKRKKLCRTLATFGALLFLVLIVVALLELIIPQIINSIVGMVNVLPGEVKAVAQWINTQFDGESEMAVTMSDALVRATDFFDNWIKTDVLPQASTYIASITNGVITIVKLLVNIIIGLIISVYVLLEKEKFIGQAKKLIYAIFKPEAGNAIVTTLHKSNDIFGGFISGKLLDSAIIGVICYIVLCIMKMPYTVLVSVIVGVTNIVPFFGPYIGAIPSIIIIALADPMKGLYFLIFIIILQQIDGNIIGPKILGDSTGLSSFWVVFAILLGSGLFGVGGMILGVPVFAVIYYLAQKIIAYCLRRKNLPDDTASYIELTSVDAKTNTICYEPDDTAHHKFKKRHDEKKAETALRKESTDSVENKEDN